MSERIVFYDDQNLSSGDMTVIRSGLLDIYNNINGARHKTATLNRVAVGVAAVNKWLELPGYWQEPPTVVLSPKKMPSYFTDFQMSKQGFSIDPQVSLVRDGVYKIFPEFTFYVGKVSANEAPGLLIAGSAAPGGVGAQSCGNPHQDICTPFYLSPGGGVSVAFRYRMSYQRDTQGSSGVSYYNNVSVYLDVSRGGSITSHLLRNRGAWAPDAEQTVSATRDVGNGFCQWRLRMSTSYSSSRDGPKLSAAYHYLILNSYSFSFTGTSFSPTDAEVFYLAVGR